MGKKMHSLFDVAESLYSTNSFRRSGMILTLILALFLTALIQENILLSTHSQQLQPSHVGNKRRGIAARTTIRKTIQMCNLDHIPFLISSLQQIAINPNSYKCYGLVSCSKKLFISKKTQDHIWQFSIWNDKRFTEEEFAGERTIDVNFLQNKECYNFFSSLVKLPFEQQFFTKDDLNEQCPLLKKMIFNTFKFTKDQTISSMAVYPAKIWDDSDLVTWNVVIAVNHEMVKNLKCGINDNGKDIYLWHKIREIATTKQSDWGNFDYR